VALVLLGGLFVWRFSPLPSATWSVTDILVDGKQVDPLGATITTSLGNITFNGCNTISTQVGGLPWRPSLGTSSTTAMGCVGPQGDLDAIWARLAQSPVTFDGAWKRTATLRGSSVEIRLSRAH